VEYWQLYHQVRAVVYEWIRGMPPAESFVMTNALTREAVREVESWEAVQALAAARGARFVPVTLECSLGENIRRVQSADRRHRKLVIPDPLIDWRSKFTLLTGDGEAALTVDTTLLGPEQAADQIVAHVRRLPPLDKTVARSS
jgi:hypothetical protein